MIEAEGRGIGKHLPMHPTERKDIKPLVGMGWLLENILKIRIIEITITITNQSEEDKTNTIVEKLFKANRKTQDSEIKNQLKTSHG